MGLLLETFVANVTFEEASLCVGELVPFQVVLAAEELPTLRTAHVDLGFTAPFVSGRFFLRGFLPFFRFMDNQFKIVFPRRCV